MESTFDASEVYEKLNRLKTRLPKALDAMAEVGAQKMEEYAKPHAPWTDRTGQARLRLKGSHDRTEDEITISIAQGVDYGIWLELAHEKRFAILSDTLNATAPEIIQGFQGLMDKVKV